MFIKGASYEYIKLSPHYDIWPGVTITPMFGGGGRSSTKVNIFAKVALLTVDRHRNQTPVHPPLWDCSPGPKPPLRGASAVSSLGSLLAAVITA